MIFPILFHQSILVRTAEFPPHGCDVVPGLFLFGFRRIRIELGEKPGQRFPIPDERLDMVVGANPKFMVADMFRKHGDPANGLVCPAIRDFAQEKRPAKGQIGQEPLFGAV